MVAVAEVGGIKTHAWVALRWVLETTTPLCQRSMGKAILLTKAAAEEGAVRGGESWKVILHWPLYMSSQEVVCKTFCTATAPVMNTARHSKVQNSHKDRVLIIGQRDGGLITPTKLRGVGGWGGDEMRKRVKSSSGDESKKNGGPD